MKSNPFKVSYLVKLFTGAPLFIHLVGRGGHAQRVRKVKVNIALLKVLQEAMEKLSFSELEGRSRPTIHDLVLRLLVSEEGVLSGRVKRLVLQSQGIPNSRAMWKVSGDASLMKVRKHNSKKAFDFPWEKEIGLGERLTIFQLNSQEEVKVTGALVRAVARQTARRFNIGRINRFDTFSRMFMDLFEDLHGKELARMKTMIYPLVSRKLPRRKYKYSTVLDETTYQDDLDNMEYMEPV